MRRLLVCAAAAVVSAALFRVYARFEWPWAVLGWIALVPWLAALDGVRSLRGALAAGLVMAVVFTCVVFGWFAAAMAQYTGASWAIAALAVAVLSPALQPQFLVFAPVRHALRRRGASLGRLALGGAAAYVATEWAWGKLFGDTLGYGLWPAVWMRQAADLAGVPLLTVVLVVANECLLAAGRAAAAGRPRAAAAPLATVAALATALLAYGAVRTAGLARPPGAAPVVAAIVQADVSNYDRLKAHEGTFAAVRRILDAHFARSRAALAARPLDLVLWPETAYPTTFGVPKSPEGAAFDREIAGFSVRHAVPLVFGAYDAADGQEFNAAVVLEPSPDGDVTFDAYRKAALFPLTERVPRVLDGPWLREWMPWLGTWAPGGGGDVLVVGLRDGRRLRLGPLICYDVLEPRLAWEAARAGAEVLVTLSNDSWLAGGPGPRLHLVGAAFRSVETRRPQLRATNTGVSAVIDAGGGLVETAGVHEEATLIGTVHPATAPPPPAVHVGGWLGPVAAGMALVLLLVPGPAGAPHGAPGSRGVTSSSRPSSSPS